MSTPPKIDTIYCGDAERHLRRFETSFANTIVTSPPYFRQRNYSDRHQIGQEKSPDEYIERLVSVFREAREGTGADAVAWGALASFWRRC